MQNYTAGPSSTLSLECLRVTVPEIWAGQNRGGKKRKKRKKKKKEKKMNIDKTKEKKEKKEKRKKKKNEHRQNYIASPTGTLTRQVLGRPVCDRGAIPRTLVQ